MIKRELIVNVPVDHCRYANVYINNNTGLTVNLCRTENTNILEAAIPLAIEVAARPNDEHKHIICKPMIAKDKLAVERDLADTKIF